MRISSNRMWIGLYLVVVMALLWVGSGFISKIILIQRFSNPVEGKALEWGVLSLGEEKYQVFARYEAGKFSGKHVFQRPVYKTRESAEDAMEVMRTERVTVWHNGKGALLEHEFPIKEATQTGITVIILLYFIFLRRYLNQFSPNN